MERILLAGATGYLGSFILQELIKQNITVTVIARNPEKLKAVNSNFISIIKAEVTKPESIIDCCKEIDVVISTVGITRQKDGFTYMDVDYQANMNLLAEAKKSDVKKFIYISVLNGDKLKNLKICEAKEKFVEALKSSGLNYCVVRPGGYFSDMREFYQMAQKGRVYLFGKGNCKINPIHGIDLAGVCINAIKNETKEINVGGPEILSHNQIAKTAFLVAGKKIKITYIPGWLSRFVLSCLRKFTSSKIYGPIEFFMTVLTMDFIAPQYGNHTLKSYFEELKKNESNS